MSSVLSSSRLRQPDLLQRIRCYGHVVRIALQDALEYRFNLLFGLCSAFLPIGAVLLLWQAIYGYGGVEQLGVYTYREMVAYYVVMFVVQQVGNPGELQWRLALEIRRGYLSRYLIKPVSHMLYELARLAGANTTILGQLFVPLVVLAVAHPALLRILDLAILPVFLVSCVLALLLNFLRAYIEGLLAFWMEDTSIFYFLEANIIALLSGAWIPLLLFPDPIYAVLRFLPFPYMLAFPVHVYLGKLPPDEIATGLTIQLAWVAIFFALARLAWQRGLRRYCAAGA
jgi:ABC-2 type transport system permease protein